MVHNSNRNLSSTKAGSDVEEMVRFGQSGVAKIVKIQVKAPDEIADKIFTPLFTTKSKGQGFGLPVVKKLIEAIDGTVTFEE